MMNGHYEGIFFFFNDTATTEIYTLSLHDALPILVTLTATPPAVTTVNTPSFSFTANETPVRSEEHTSELQSRPHLACRLLLETKTTALAVYCWRRLRELQPPNLSRP